LFAATLISYVDRQSMSVVAPVIVGEFHLNNQQISRILSSFLLAYAFGQLVVGRFLDWTGTRAGLAISVVWWSLANMLTATVTRPWGFSFFRFMLGVGKSENFPGGVKVLGEWFPPHERAFAGGLFMSGASVGGVIAPPLVAAITDAFGWRAAFIFTGSLGFAWLIFWLAWYRLPEDHKMLTSSERTLILETRDRKADDAMPWRDLFRYRQVWALIIARILEEPVIWMVLFWLPKYMVDVGRLSLMQTGWAVAIPFISLDAGYIGGGWLSSRLIRRGLPAHKAKLAVMTLGAAAMLGSIPAAYSTGVPGLVTAISFSTVGN
jgi:ACS family hexuronate transporter-like MFS transporter